MGRRRLAQSRVAGLITAAFTVTALFVTVAVPAQSRQSPTAYFTGRPLHAVGHQVGGGSTTVGLLSTGLISHSSGRAQVQAKAGARQFRQKFGRRR